MQKLVYKRFLQNQRVYKNINYFVFIVGITTGYRIGDLLSLKFSHFFNEDYSFKKEIDIVEQKTNKRQKMPITESIQTAINLYIGKNGSFYLYGYDFSYYASRHLKSQF